MLLTQTSFSSSPTIINFSLGKYSHKHDKAPFLDTFEKNNLSSTRSTRNRKLRGVDYNSCSRSYFSTCPHQQPFGSESVSLDLEFGGDGSGSGIGIDNFFAGKNIFITGATGLLGKALVEKLLRSTRVGKIYLLVKAKDKEAALDRLSKEIIQSELFESIRQKHGKSYDEFAREKLIPIVGNICEPNLGMDAYSLNAVMNQIDVIIESAANTTFNDRYDVMIDANVNAPQRLMRLAIRCKNLKLFVHFSTAYVNGSKEGVIMEKPWVMGECCGRKQDDDDVFSSPNGVDVADEISINLTTKSRLPASNTDYDVTKQLQRLGMERAALFGWHNTYQLTKAMGEMVLNEIRGHVPLLIMRPSIIESSYKEPFPGWIQGNRMADPVIISYGKGLLPAYLADPNVPLDIVPIDMVVNTTIAAIAKHGRGGVTHKKAAELNVYHVATSFENPLPFSDLLDYTYEHFSANPLTHSASVTKIKFFNEFSEFSKYVRDEMSVTTGMRNAVGVRKRTIEKRYKANVDFAEQLCKIYEFTGFFKARFHTGNTHKLLQEMSKEEKVEFEIDVSKIDWRKYIVEIHIPGLRKHVLDVKKPSV